MDEDLKELEAMLKNIDSKVKRSTSFKLLKLIKSTLPASAFVIFGIVLFFLVVIGAGAIFDSLKFIEINDGVVVENDFYENTSGFFDPKKISTYMQIENNSYTEYVDGEEDVNIYLGSEKIFDYTSIVRIKINMTREHRLHWQMLAAIDILSGYGENSLDNTVERLSSELISKFEYYNYYETITSQTVVEIPTLNGNNTVQMIQTTVVTRPQIVIKSVNSALFDINYEYEKIIIEDSELNKTTECYVVADADKKINNRLDNLLNNQKFKNRITIQNAPEIHDFGAEFPQSTDFSSYMLEYLALNTNINMTVKNYNGEGNYKVTEDDEQFRVPIKFEKENSIENKVYISSFFGERYLTIAGITQKNFHRGIDFAIPSGTPIVAAAEGKIIRADYSKSYGNVIEIKHNDIYTTVYAHNSRLTVKVGDEVKKGDTIALSGNTGVSTGPHLHFEVKRNSEPVDPFSMLNLE